MAAASIQHSSDKVALTAAALEATNFSFANLGGVLEELNNQFGKIFRRICRR